jgi:uncharacterized sporulation protein YeaH/YhbH (DUF444 family)
MPLIIDKRFLPKGATIGSRQKFIDRYKGAIKQRIRDMIDKNSIKDFNKGSKKIKIKIDDLDSPSFELDPTTGNKDHVLIGNKKFKKGDALQRPKKGGGQSGKKAGNSGGGDDGFEFTLTEEEFAQLFFEDLELPDLIKRQFSVDTFEIQPAGYSKSGGPSSLNVKKTILNSLGRRFIQRKKDQLIAELKDMETAENVDTNEKFVLVPKKKVQFIEEMDLRYNFRDKVEQPTTKAVMFCMLDVSGSMGEEEKDIAKRFFILLNLFLKRNYEQVDIVFIRHADTAEEVDEQKFFYDTWSGGTVISSGYEKIKEVMNTRYNPETWNVYIAQASDGDNFEYDNELMTDLLVNKILPNVQYMAYINIGERGYGNTEFLDILDKIASSSVNFKSKIVTSNKDIFEVFRSLFKRKTG